MIELNKVSKLTLTAGFLVLVTKLLGMLSVILSFEHAWRPLASWMLGSAFVTIACAIVIASIQLKREAAQWE